MSNTNNKPIYNVLEKLKQFVECPKNKNKCTPKYALKLLSDQLDYGKPIYQSKHVTQQFDSNKMEIFQFEVFFDSEQLLKGENLPYGKYKTSQHLAALSLLKSIFEVSFENECGNEIL